jgi:hypothetical protein
MYKQFFILVLIPLIYSNTFSQTKKYFPYDKTYSADINKNIILLLDSMTPGMTLLNNVFKPIKGKYIVHRFIAKFIGMSFTNKQKEFHDLLIVKTDNKNEIIEAYQYTLEWADSPDVDLYKSSCHKLYLTDNMSISDFKFRRPWYYDSKDRKLIDSGTIILK